MFNELLFINGRGRPYSLAAANEIPRTGWDDKRMKCGRRTRSLIPTIHSKPCLERRNGSAKQNWYGKNPDQSRCSAEPKLRRNRCSHYWWMPWIQIEWMAEEVIRKRYLNFSYREGANARKLCAGVTIADAAIDIRWKRLMQWKHSYNQRLENGSAARTPNRVVRLKNERIPFYNFIVLFIQLFYPSEDWGMMLLKTHWVHICHLIYAQQYTSTYLYL